MSSLFLGALTGRAGRLEVHAFTLGLPFREIPVRAIADPVLYRRLLEGRYAVLAGGRPIYCTAVAPDTARGIEVNPHDDRPGTVHLAALTAAGDIRCAISVAVDIGERDGGGPVGLPLENRWRPGNFPPGASLDGFRARYLECQYRLRRGVQAWEMAELYRHYKPVAGDDPLPRLAVYAGIYELLVHRALRAGRTPSWLLVFDAIPRYFNLYRLAAGGMLRDPAIADRPRLLSPPADALETGAGEPAPVLRYRGAPVSRAVSVPIPRREEGGLVFDREWVAFLDGVVDVRRMRREIQRHVLLPRLPRVEGFRLAERFELRLALAVIARRVYLERHGDSPWCRWVEQAAFEEFGIEAWDFPAPSPPA